MFAAEILNAPPMALAKISTLLLFARIFPNQTFKRILWALGLFISTYSAIIVITIIFQCKPIKRVWDPTVEAECIDINTTWNVLCSLTVLTDILLLCLPLPQLWKLQMPRGTKLQVIGIFSIGSLSVNCARTFDTELTGGSSPNSVTVISSYRISKLHGLSLYSDDPTWNDDAPNLWSIVEISAAILGACTITYRPLFDRMWKPRSSSSRRRPQSSMSSPDLIESSVEDTKTEAGPSVQGDIKVHSLGASLPSLPLPTYNPCRESGIWGDYCRLSV